MICFEIENTVISRYGGLLDHNCIGLNMDGEATVYCKRPSSRRYLILFSYFSLMKITPTDCTLYLTTTAGAIWLCLKGKVNHSDTVPTNLDSAQQSFVASADILNLSFELTLKKNSFSFAGDWGNDDDFCCLCCLYCEGWEDVTQSR